MSFSSRTLSLVTVVLILGTVAAAVGWRLVSDGDAAEDEPTEGQEVATEALDAASASQFSTAVPQPVTGAAVVRDTLWIRVTAAGQAEAARRATLTSQVEGVVTAVPARENQEVSADTRLLQIDTTDLALEVAQARADLSAAEAEYRQMVLFNEEVEDPAVREERERIARSRSGLDQREVSLRQAEIRLARSTVRAPFGGRIADLEVVAGQHVPVGTQLLTVVDLNPIHVEVRVLEAELGWLSSGREARVTFAAYPGETFRGTVQTLNPVVDPETRTGRVTVGLDNADGRIKPGMYAEVALDAEALPDRVLVPREAILERGEGRRRTMLFVYEEGEDGGQGLAKWRYVTTGRENEEMVEIVPGGEGMVDPGETVLVDGHHYLAHDTPIRLVEDVQAAGGRPGR